jgi:hypothetical protein
MDQSNGTRWERPDAPLGTLVYRAGLLSKDKLEAALEEGQKSGRRLGEILLQKGWIDEKDLARLLAGQKGLQFVSLKGRGYERDTAKLLPERVCRYHNAVPVEASGERILVAIADPTDDGALQEIRDELGRPIELVVAATSEIRSALDEIFGGAAPAPAPVAAPDEAAAPPVSAISPIGDLGLRIAAPPPDPEPEQPVEPDAAPEPVAAAEPAAEPAAVTEPEPVVAEPESVPAVEPEPAPAAEPVAAAEPEPAPAAEPMAAAEPAPDPAPHVIALPDPVAPADAVPEREPPAAAEPEAAPAPPAPVPSIESITSALPDPVPSVSEPTIERNEEAHVSVAFNVPHVSEPAPAEPVSEPEPPVQPELEPEPAAVAPQPIADGSEQRPSPADAPFCLVLNLVDGEEVDVAYFAQPDEATAAARALVAGITRDAEWPQVGRTFYPPERIASVEIRERRSFTGNAARAGFAPDRPAS